MLSKSRLFIAILLVSGAFISCVNTNKVITNTARSPILNVVGRVTNQETGEPISGVDVWVEGTSIHQKTNKKGEYSFRVPRGYYDLLTHSEEGAYLSESKELHLEANMWADQTVNFELEEKDKNTNSGNSEADQKELKNLFISHYINDEINKEDGLKCTVQNPDDIHFVERDEEGVMDVMNPVEIKVQNQDLGYDITILLEKYISKDYGEILGKEVTASYLFEKMTPSNPEEAQKWEKNREEHFNGSFRHFLIAMVSDKTPLTFGYRIYLGQSVTSTSAMAYTETSVNDIEAEKSSFILPPLRSNGAYILRFREELRVENVESGIYDPQNIMGLDNYLQETSWVSLMTQSVEFSNNGLLKEPQNVSLRGVWRYTPVCKMIPKDYLPQTKK